MLPLPTNTGFSGGNNWGIRAALAADYEAVFLLNTDVIIDEEFILPCVNVLKECPEVGVVGPVILEGVAPHLIQCEGGRITRLTLNFDYNRRGDVFERREELVDVGYVLGAAMLVRTVVFQTVGLFDEDYNPAYVEEADFCFRARQAGFRCVIHRGAAIKHIGEQAATSTQKTFDRISVRRFYFGVKHSGPLYFVVGSLLVVARVVYWKCRAKVRGITVSGL